MFQILFDYIDLIQSNRNKKRCEVAEILSKKTGVAVCDCDLFIQMYN